MAPDRTPSTILVIDDEVVVCTFAKRTLEKLGYKVLMANGGREGVAAILRDRSIALVLLDATMPLMSGEETFRKIKAARPEMTVVLCSGYAESGSGRPTPSSAPISRRDQGSPGANVAVGRTRPSPVLQITSLRSASVR